MNWPAFNWLHAPANHDIIARRTVTGASARHTLALPQPADPERFEFLVIGDTGDSEVAGVAVSPQDAVGAELAADACLPASAGRGRLVLHLGDVVYMTGERRLYDRNFRRPYAAFLTPDSTFERLVFRLPFLPVPGNHDYYDFPVWAGWLARAPVLGLGFRAIARELFAFSIPRGGSDMGRAFADAFVSEPAEDPMPYQPGVATRIPNRYYRFRYGSVEFFALDSNTLDGFPPAVETKGVQADAVRSVAELRARVRDTEERIRIEQGRVAAWRQEQRRRIALDPARVARLDEVARDAVRALGRLADGLAAVTSQEAAAAPALAAARRAHEAWSRAAGGGAGARPAAPSARDMRRRFEAHDRAAQRTHEAQRALEECLVRLPEGAARRQILAAGADLEAALVRWEGAAAAAPPPEAQERLARLSERALALQRSLARETRRVRYRPDDWDGTQLRWLDAALDESERERPDAWRIVYLHHPLYTSAPSYCETDEIQEIRANLVARLGTRVHAVFSGHAHAFEWLRCGVLPHTGVFVSGGGGQLRLGRSVFDPRRLARHVRRARRLKEAGVQELVQAGRGPRAADGAAGQLWHYLRVEVTPDVLRIRPVGVRRGPAGWRREAPMPVHHAATVSTTAPAWAVRRLEAIEVRRGAPPEARWA